MALPRRRGSARWGRLAPNRRKRGRSLESDDYVSCSGHLILECKECGEHLTLLGLIDDWRSERTNFECRCGETLTLEDRTNEEGVVI